VALFTDQLNVYIRQAMQKASIHLRNMGSRWQLRQSLKESRRLRKRIKTYYGAMKGEDHVLVDEMLMRVK
jgi:hypothetical protein